MDDNSTQFGVNLFQNTGKYNRVSIFKILILPCHIENELIFLSFVSEILWQFKF